MTTTRSIGLLFVPALAASALALASPAAAMGGSDGQAVAQCRIELLRHFPTDSIRSQRISEISGNSRRTRVSMFVTTDRRYTFECIAGADGRVLTASVNPPLETRLAGAAPANQAPQR